MHWVAVLLSLILTTGAWYFTSLQVTQQSEARFERYSDQVVDLVMERMQRYEDALASGVATVHSFGGDMSHAEWVQFAGALKIESKYPGINGMGVIHNVPREDLETYLAEQRQARPDYQVHPTHDFDVLYPITYIEPAGINAAAIGLDVAHETNRRKATIRARDTGQPQITGPIILVQDAMQTPGFLFYMPFYQNDQGRTVRDRRENFSGMVYAPFIFKQLIEGVLGQDNRQVHFSVRDADTMLYDEKVMDGAHEPEFTKVHEARVYGRTWTFEIWETPEFTAANRSNEPLVILIGGLIIDALLFSIFVLLTRSNRRALRFADDMAREATDRAECLQRSNEDLERFAYVASHDLKTPLRGIGFLSECIRDNLDSLPVEVDDVEMRSNLALLDEQVQRMENLITGILVYSSIQPNAISPKTVDTDKLLTTLCTTAGLAKDMFTIKGAPVQFETDAVRLEQVLQNLIVNATKYHHDPDNLKLEILVEDAGDTLAFTVTDNGPGIDQRFHSRIFGMFQTLHPNTDVQTTGIGLAIVLKIVQLYGGQVRLKSEPGQGSSFSFDWPKHTHVATAMPVAA